MKRYEKIVDELSAIVYRLDDLALITKRTIEPVKSERALSVESLRMAVQNIECVIHRMTELDTDEGDQS